MLAPIKTPYRATDAARRFQGTSYSVDSDTCATDRAVVYTCNAKLTASLPDVGYSASESSGLSRRAEELDAL